MSDKNNASLNGLLDGDLDQLDEVGVFLEEVEPRVDRDVRDDAVQARRVDVAESEFRVGRPQERQFRRRLAACKLYSCTHLVVAN